MKNLTNIHLTALDKQAVNYLLQNKVEFCHSKNKVYKMEVLNIEKSILEAKLNILECEELQKTNLPIEQKIILSLQIDAKNKFIESVKNQKSVTKISVYKNEKFENNIYLKN